MNFQGELQVLFTLHGLVNLFILALLELILGVDNIIFISLILSRVPKEKRFNTRLIALSLAFVMRIIMLFSLVWLSHVTTTLFAIDSFQVSIRDILFFVGGAYLIYNTIKELLNHFQITQSPNQPLAYKSIIAQIVIVDVLFSFDSIFTAIGLMPNFIIMTIAIGLGMVFMIYLSGKTSAFIEKNPTIKTLALCFIIAVGLMLVTEAFHIEIPKGYLYAAFGVAFIVERGFHRLKRKN